MIDGLDAESENFHRDEVSLHCRQQFFECIDGLALTLVDKLDQKEISLLSCVEEFFIFSLKSHSSVSLEEFEIKLSFKRTKHFSADACLGKLKSAFTNVRLRFKNRNEIAMFGNALEFFEDIVKCEFNQEFLSPNAVKSLRLAIIHPATAATCERSFRLAKLIKTDTREAMTYRRFNHLRVLKDHKEILEKECSVGELMCEFAKRNDRGKKHFGKIPVKKKMRSVV